MTEEKFVAGPDVDLQEQIPKRGRGRPPALNPDGTRKNPPGKRGRPRRNVSLKPQIQAFLSLTNIGVVMLQGNFPPPIGTGDALDDNEIELLADGLDKQCQISPRFRKYVSMVIGAGTGGQLFAVVGMIGARRAARHNLIPNELDNKIGRLMGNMELADVPQESPESTEQPIENDSTNAAA